MLLDTHDFNVSFYESKSVVLKVDNDLTISAMQDSMFSWIFEQTCKVRSLMRLASFPSIDPHYKYDIVQDYVQLIPT